ncbi:D-alanyl-D-alanine carboxypeptidase/D-alanyl-D-alanine-endopeptidase [Massilia sp. G4R7]|uniref:D-alanyl-D-alanine carboxypeptidase/D-alanyl-D-alanine-endopeptidase n=1 Tax=Massilia phyllostachyos TaxID=2898585 RepID=A0ABS8Q808_9BURK|nr:D-alanyl-D-alanine carboxypeptidase/D-alanyl-D-alanine-endopeptidase [Massilia phyllostachyos]MCD2517888.1 D-alanyl-D-alanine carboxypeptidase/D-alanyl-D-alanine-endopeptidase [Massilia phyllostachyos]
MLRRFALASLLLAVFGAAHAQLPAPVAQVMVQQGLTDNDLGILVLKGDAVVLAHQADRPMQPASTMKLVTTMVSLERLGPAFRGRTELRSSGEIVNGVLRGNLVLRGGADADLSGADIETMLRALHYQGVRRIEGDLVLDRGVWNPGRLDVGLPPFDESPEAYYNVIPDPLLVNKNMLQIDLRSTTKRLTLEMQPELDRVSIGSDMTLVDADCAKWEDGWKLPEAVRQKDGRIKVLLHGTFPKDCARSTSINVLDRDDYIDRLFRQKWKELGGKFSGKVVTGIAPLDARLLAEHSSRTLPELVRDTNKPSDNLLARTLFLSLGSLQADPVAGSFAAPASGETTFVRAEAAVRDWMRAHRIDDAGFVIENGSGLSRLERITPQQMAYLLQAGLRSNWSPEFQSSMPIAGIDGTMRRRLQGTAAAGRARLKTGTLRNVVALAGYVPDADGVQNVFVAFVNSEQAGNGRGRAVLDALVEWVARSGQLPQVAPAPAAP